MNFDNLERFIFLLMRRLHFIYRYCILCCILYIQYVSKLIVPQTSVFCVHAFTVKLTADFKIFFTKKVFIFIVYVHTDRTFMELSKGPADFSVVSHAVIQWVI